MLFINNIHLSTGPFSTNGIVISHTVSSEHSNYVNKLISFFKCQNIEVFPLYAIIYTQKIVSGRHFDKISIFPHVKFSRRVRLNIVRRLCAKLEIEVIVGRSVQSS